MNSSAGAGPDAKMLPCTARPGTRGGTVGAMTSRCLGLITLHNVLECNAHELSLMLENPTNTAPAFLPQGLFGLSARPLPEKLIRATCSNELSLLERILKIRAISKFRVEQITLAFRFGQT